MAGGHNFGGFVGRPGIPGPISKKLRWPKVLICVLGVAESAGLCVRSNVQVHGIQGWSNNVCWERI